MSTERLEHSTHHLLFENSPEPSVICDTSFKVIETNRALNERFHPDVIRDLRSLIGNPGVFNEIVTLLQQERELRNYPCTLESIHGRCFVMISASRVRNDQGRIEWYYFVLNDVSALRTSQEARRKSDRMAFANRLTQLIAHEVNNPLTNINLAVEQMVASPSLNEQDKELYFDLIRRNVSRISDLINLMLESNRPTALNLEETTLNEILESSIQTAEDRLDLFGVRASLTLSEPDPIVTVDKGKVILAISNIINNAIEAMDGCAERNLILDARLEDDMNVIRISDTGKGMNEEELEQLFEPFYSGKRSGRGLGTTLTRNIVEAHGGDIRVQSEPGRGSTFTITLPV